MLWCTFYGKCKLADSCGNKVLFLIYGRRELVCKSSLQTVISLFIRVGEFNDTAAWGSMESYLNIWQKDNANIVPERKRQMVQLCAFILHPAVIFWREVVSWLHSKPCNVHWFWIVGHICFPCILHAVQKLTFTIRKYLPDLIHLRAKIHGLLSTLPHYFQNTDCEHTLVKHPSI